MGLRRFMASAAERQRLSRRRKFAILGLVQTDLRSSERLSFAPRSAASRRESYAPALAAVTDSGMVERKTLSGGRKRIVSSEVRRINGRSVTVQRRRSGFAIFVGG